MTAAVMASSGQAAAAAPPVAILNAKYNGRARGSSVSKTPGALGGTTPGSYSNSFIDHAFDYPTPTSFSQLQFLSSSVASNDGADYTHRVPKVEERFCSGFFCCGVQLDDLHHLLEHFEECHVNVANGQVVIGSDSANIAVAAAAAAAQQQGQLTGVQTSPVNGKLSVNNLKNAKAALKQQQQAQQSPKSASGTSQRQSSRLQQSTSINGSASNQKRSRKQSLRAGSSALASTADDDTLADDRDGDFDSDNGEDMLDGDMPQFDDFEQEEKERQAALSGATAEAMASTSSSNAASPSAIPPAMSALAGQSSNPTLSAPPSPALSSYSDHPSLFRQRNKTASSASLVNMTVRKATSRSPPSPNSLNADSPVSAFDDVGGQLHFARRTRQQSVDSVASVSTNASTSSKKRSFGAAMGPGTSNNLNASSARGRPSSVVGLGSQMPGIDLTHMRNPSIISTPDSSRPGSPASEFDGLTYSLLSGPNGGNGNVNTNVLPTMSTLSLLNANTASTALPPNQGTSAAAMSGISAATPAANLLGAGEGCLPPSLLFPAVRGNSKYDQDDDTDSMHTDEDHDDFDNESQGDYSEQGDASYDDGMLGDEDMAYMRNSAAFPNAQMAMGSMHASKRKRMSSTPQQQNGFMTRQKRNGYDSNADSAAAAMFSPLTLLGVNGSGEGHRNGYNPAAKASAATLAAIQAAAAANAFPSGSTPTGRVWIPNNAKPFKCPVPGCDKAYKQQNGLKYHRLHGHCSAGNNSSQGEAVEEKDDGSDDKPFGCYVGPACGKKYKNMNGLRYHYQHSGAHGQIGLQMLGNGTHPPPNYPPGHKRSASRHAFSEHAHNAATTVVMNQATAEALLASISSVGGSSNNTPSGSRSNSRPSTPRIGHSPARSRNVSPNPVHRSPTRSGSNTSVPSLSRLNGSSSGVYNYDESLST